MESNSLRTAFNSQQHRTFAANAQKEEDSDAPTNVPPTWTDNSEMIQMDDNQEAFPGQQDSGDDHGSLDANNEEHERNKSVGPEDVFHSAAGQAQPLPLEILPGPEAQEAPKAVLVNENALLRFQLIPISETPGKAAVGEVLERKIKPGLTIKIGRQIVRDGQTTIKGNKKATEIDIWFTSKVVSRLHAEIWTKDGQLCIKDVGSSSGTFLNKMRLSPSGKESRPYPLKQGDVLQFGVDFKGKSETLKSLLAATNPYGNKDSEQTDTGAETECCICLGSIAPFQALFIAPCSHCYHYKCVGSIIAQSPMFQCPLCRQVANLTASVSSESLHADNEAYIELPSITAPIDFSEDAATPSAAQAPSSRRGSNANVKPQGKRMSIIQGLGMLGIRQHQEAPGPSNSTSPTPPQNATTSPTENSGANLQRKASKKRTFSMKIQNFLGRKENADGVPHFDENEDPGRNPMANVPRTSHVVPGEQPQAEIPGESAQAQAKNENNNLVNAEN
ncbi:hypothetical protein HDV01_000656 [Terramyces sp. JEL0728]|nr:hypothetical protein HDV01_000656 [Terramyces sp. JEL0728]